MVLRVENWKASNGNFGAELIDFLLVPLLFSLFFPQFEYMSPSKAELTPKNDDISGDLEETAAGGGRWFCCLSNFTCSNWERISTSGRGEQQDGGDRHWWCKGVDAWKRARAWSAVVAGPKWTKFMRRCKRKSKPGKLNYDAISYSLNFDEGRSQNGVSDPDKVSRGFISRYALIPIQNAQSKDTTTAAPRDEETSP